MAVQIKCFSHSYISTASQLTSRLKGLYQDGARSGQFQTELSGIAVKQVVMATSHFVLLMDNGRIYRIPYSLSNDSKEKSDDDGASTSSVLSGSRGGSPRGGEQEAAGFSSFAQRFTNLISRRGRLAGRRIIMERRSERLGRTLLSRAPMVPVSEIPEELIEEAMSVLQGKSREVVIRELQRTNLDVNTAVNNLLSRDDDDETGNDHDEFVPSGDEILTLLGSGALAEEDMEEILALSSRSRDDPFRRDARSGIIHTDPLITQELRSWVTLADRAATGGSGSSTIPSSVPGTSGSTNRNNKGSNQQQVKDVSTSVHFGAQSCWRGGEDAKVFSVIATTVSELLAVDDQGQLYGWPWSSTTPPSKPHPRSADLGLQGERIRHLSARVLRATAVTESGKVATWVDPQVAKFGKSLEHSATSFTELAGETIVYLSTSELFSTVFTESGRVYWWGVLPFLERKTLISQVQDKNRSYYSGSTTLGGSRSDSIHEGSQVCLRSRPIYSAGCHGIYIKGSSLKCGELQESVFSLSEKCRFKIVDNSSTESMEVDAKLDTPSPSVGSKRPYPVDEEEENEDGGRRGQEELWSLRDVIFLTPPLSSTPLGTVVKLDGLYAAVLFPSLTPPPQETREEEEEGGAKSILSQCRLLRKDDLIVVPGASQPDLLTVQTNPKKLKLPSDSVVLAVAVDVRGVYLILSNQGTLSCCTFNLETTKLSLMSNFPEPSSHFLSLHLLPRPPLHPPPMKLISLGLSLWLLVDSSGGLYPLAKDSMGGMKQLPLLNLPPVQALTVTPFSSKQLLVAMVFQPQQLIPLLRQGNLSNLRDFLQNLQSSDIEQYLQERTHGGCNILHLLATLSSPARATPLPSSGGRGSRPPGLREMMHQALQLASSSNVSEPRLWTMGMEGNEEEIEESDKDDRSSAMLSLLRHISTYSTHFHDTFIDLMTEINLTGYTPFMAAVACKAYSIALHLLELAYNITGGDEDMLVAMLYPLATHPDDNPLFILCHNDPCSFTWTGEEHIHQDIFECRTCGLTGSLCCCTECAYTCHRGHDCSFKRASPNAYCDCWEKCSCQALVPGDDLSRMNLLRKLLSLPFLSTRTNGRGEHLLGMLINTVARQRKEQSQWMGKKSSASFRHRNMSRFEGNSADVPAHNFHPPKFASNALMEVLEDWVCVRAALLHEESELNTGTSNDWPFFLSLLEQHRILKSQTQTKYLDVLTYTLLAKTTHNIVETLVTTLVNQVGPQRNDREAVITCQRFLRSLLRVFVVCELEKTGGVETNTSSISKKKILESDHSSIYKEAVFILSSLAPLAISELVMTARAIITPVCMGVARPFMPCIMNDKHKISEELFTLPHVNLQRQLKTPPISVAGGNGSASEAGSTVGGVSSTGGGGEGISDSESDVGEGEEIHTHGDASSTATVGSGPVPFFSDQESSDGEDLDSVGEEGSIDGGDHMEEESFTLAVGGDTLVNSRMSGTTHWALPESNPTRRFSRSSGRDTHSYNTTVLLLTQSFSSLIRLIAELQATLIIDGPHPPFVLQPLPTDNEKVHAVIWEGLEKVWVWLATVMDSIEAQLRLGCALNRSDSLEQVPRPSINQTSNILQQNTPSTSTRSSESLGLEGRRGFLNYLLSLMRGESNEHHGFLPALDMARMEHIAWAADSLIFLLTHSLPPQSSSLEVSSSVNNVPFTEGQRRFFRRSSSTVCLSYPPVSPFAPLIETLPLAERPQLLHPRQTKENMFGFSNQEVLEVWPQTVLPPPSILPLIKNPIPIKLGLNRETNTEQLFTRSVVTPDQISCESSNSLAACVLLGRWCMTVDLLGRMYADTLGRHRHSIFNQLQGFEVIERDLRREMDHLRSSAHRDLQIEVERERERLLPELFRRLNDHCEFHRVSSNQQPLCVHRLRVSFRNEQGEGSGVVRSFFTAISEAVTSESNLPELDHRLSHGHSDRPISFAEFYNDLTSGHEETIISSGELSPLFFQPGKPGFYSIRISSNTPPRLNAYRNIGRVIGLALLHSEMMPLPLCRHIYKYLLNKKISWHDLAFFDPVLYEGLRKLVNTAQQDENSIKDMDLSWHVTLGEFEGGSTHSLLSSPSDKPIVATDVYEYVYRYAELRMIKVIEEPLQAIRSGLYDVLPTQVLEGLTAEDMRLLLCGCQQVELDVLKKITTFTDESRKGSDQITKFKSWFWSIVERMNNRERQDLLYFWTSSPAMPANPESYQPAPSITLRPADDQHLPTSNTCISRLYLPMYSSKALLKAKLLAAIKIKTFGFI